MKRSGNILIVIGILLVIYSIIEKFIGQATINLGQIEIHAISGVIIANTIILLGISLKIWNK